MRQDISALKNEKNPPDFPVWTICINLLFLTIKKTTRRYFVQHNLLSWISTLYTGSFVHWRSWNCPFARCYHVIKVFDESIQILFPKRCGNTAGISCRIFPNVSDLFKKITERKYCTHSSFEKCASRPGAIHHENCDFFTSYVWYIVWMIKIQFCAPLPHPYLLRPLFKPKWASRHLYNFWRKPLKDKETTKYGWLL